MMHVDASHLRRTFTFIAPTGFDHPATCAHVRLLDGPNYIWHVDGYDKLKPYGFPIHGAIDGWSRKIMWLKLARSNNLPEIPATFYLFLKMEDAQSKSAQTVVQKMESLQLCSVSLEMM